MSFQALLLERGDDKVVTARVETLSDDQLPEGDVTVAVDYSTLNYKDALAITGSAPVVRQYPMVPGIDFVGRVVESRHKRWSEGDLVLLNGWGVGENHWGGLSQRARVNGDHLVALPVSLEPSDAMAIGTAGYTAMLCVMALQEAGVTPDRGEILVTGANGGVGSVAIALLAELGFTVVASTGRLNEREYLTRLGASECIDRATLSEKGKPLAKERWAGVVDSVGSHTLANACASTQYGGTVTACGLAQGMDFPATVAPFILRGVTLVGIDSVYAPLEKRQRAWARLAAELKPEALQSLVAEIPLSQAPEVAKQLLAGQVRGRVVVDVNR